jgi:ribonuclease HI
VSLPLFKPDVIAHIDGASRGNPGPAAYAVVLETPDGEPLACFSKCLGRTTNNVAEYQGLLAALEYALDNGHRRLEVISDSELLVRQIQGRYKVKSPDLKPLYEQARERIGGFERFSIRHVLRAENRQADRLANEALEGTRELAPAGSAAGKAAPPAPPSLRARAVYRKGVLQFESELPLADGEEVEVEIRRQGSVFQ